MKNIFLSSKVLVGLGLVSLVSILGFSLLGQNFASKQSSLYQLSNGLGICFQRVNQSFTALMIKDFSSEFMTKDFRSRTGDCFSELSSTLTSKSLMTNNLKTNLNNIMSDTHWFSEKLDRVVELSQVEQIDLSQSNIINKYVEIEGLKNKVEESMLVKADSMSSGKGLVFIAMVLSQLLLCASFFLLFIKQRMLSKEVNKIESEIDTKLGERDSHLVVQKIFRRLFNYLELPKTQAFVTGYHQNLMENNFKMQDHLVRMNTQGIMPEERENIDLDKLNKTFEAVDFNQSVSQVLDQMKGKAFNHGIVVDVDITGDFVVSSEVEPLNQLLFSILNFSMESSLAHSEGRKIVIKGKPLGSIAYCKFKIAGFCFDDKDLAVLNGEAPSEDTNINLAILSELVEDANVKLSVKNKHNSKLGMLESEVELIFNRASKSSNKEVSNVVKGSKREIKEFLQKGISI